MAAILDLTTARIGQLAKEGVISRLPDGKYPPEAVTQYIRYLRSSKQRDSEDDSKLSRDYLIAKTEYTKSQNVKLKRQLSLDAGKLIRADYLDGILLTFLRHFEAQTDWIRQNRTGDHELLKAHIASVKGAQRECHANKMVEGGGIDDI